MLFLRFFVRYCLYGTDFFNFDVLKMFSVIRRNVNQIFVGGIRTGYCFLRIWLYLIYNVI
jgi:hypothetical protein